MSKKSRAESRQSMKLKKQKELGQDQPIKGMIYYIVYTVLYSLNFLSAKFLYRGINLHPAAMLILRSIWAIIISIIVYNRGLKKAVYDDI